MSVNILWTSLLLFNGLIRPSTPPSGMTAGGIFSQDTMVAYLTPVKSIFQTEDGTWLPSDASAGAHFGCAIAIDNDTAIVGARADKGHGSAYVFVRNGGIWMEQAKLVANDAAPGDNFGYSVAISGDTALIGAFLAQNKGKATGAAYVFIRSGSTWTQQTKLVADDGSGFDLFGESVALSVDTAVVGAFQAGPNNVGQVYVFVQSGSTWNEQARLWASDGNSFDEFGISVAVSGDTAIVGADAAGAQGEASGAAYIFTREGKSWTEQAKVVPSDGGDHQFFGNPVAIYGDTALVGTYLGSGQASSSGAAYVFLRTGSAWMQQSKLAASDGASGDGFGISVAIHGDTIAVGAFDDSTQSIDSGSAYIFHRSCTDEWFEELKVSASDSMTGDEFGYQIALSGNSLVVGAPLRDNQNADSGAAYLFSLSGLLENGQPCLIDGDCASKTCVAQTCVCSTNGSASSGTGGARASGYGTAVSGAGGGWNVGAGGSCPIGAPPPGGLCVLGVVGGGCACHTAGASEPVGAETTWVWPATAVFAACRRGRRRGRK